MKQIYEQIDEKSLKMELDQCVPSLRIEDYGFIKKEGSYLTRQLLVWTLIRKLPLKRLFHQFINRCSACNRIYAETILDRYINQTEHCIKCKRKAKPHSILLRIVLNLIEKVLNMPKDAFRSILQNQPSLKWLVLNYMEGIGRYGLTAPLIPACPIVVLWTMTKRCNLKCTHCYLDKAAVAEELSYKEVCRGIDQLYRANTMVLGISGGEPLLRSDIFEIIKYASEKGMDIALATNGTLITPQIATRLKRVGTNYVQISVDGLKETHDRIRGKGMFEKALSGIKHCINAGMYVSLDVTVTRLNVHQVEELFQLALMLGVSKFELIDFVPSEEASKVADIALSPIELERFGIFVCYLWKRIMDNGYPLSLSYRNPIFTRILVQRMNVRTTPLFKAVFPKNTLKFFNFANRLDIGMWGSQTPFSPFITGCEPGFYVIHVKTNGDINPCPLNPTYLGNIKEDNIKEVWQESEVLNTYRNFKFDKKCGKCIYKIICGGCRAKAFIEWGKHNGRDYSCILNREC
ncbi:MAG: Antilisterial bacteriocin subtilosin biosynthesis protein AlbA [Promethearchaeota archaeon]|nr:MAG: Antilisterial bacteriocin subtilosin biosynthesis protein AlbA [Candidatus Lokiarchaeota archaeon]